MSSYPKVKGDFNPAAAAVGKSKVRAMAQIDAPFLQSRGPGYVAEKSNGFESVTTYAPTGGGDFLRFLIAGGTLSYGQTDDFGQVTGDWDYRSVSMVSTNRKRWKKAKVWPRQGFVGQYVGRGRFLLGTDIKIYGAFPDASFTPWKGKDPALRVGLISYAGLTRGMAPASIELPYLAKYVSSGLLNLFTEFMGYDGDGRAHLCVIGSKGYQRVAYEEAHAGETIPPDAPPTDTLVSEIELCPQVHRVTISLDETIVKSTIDAGFVESNPEVGHWYCASRVVSFGPGKFIFIAGCMPSPGTVYDWSSPDEDLDGYPDVIKYKGYNDDFDATKYGVLASFRSIDWGLSFSVSTVLNYKDYQVVDGAGNTVVGGWAFGARNTYSAVGRSRGIAVTPEVIVVPVIQFLNNDRLSGYNYTSVALKFVRSNNGGMSWAEPSDTVFETKITDPEGDARPFEVDLASLGGNRLICRIRFDTTYDANGYGTFIGGVKFLRSMNGGITWEALTMEGLPEQALTNANWLGMPVLVDKAPRTVAITVAEGIAADGHPYLRERNGLPFTEGVFTGIGVYESRDDGETWQRRGGYSFDEGHWDYTLFPARWAYSALISSATYDGVSFDNTEEMHGGPEATAAYVRSLYRKDGRPDVADLARPWLYDPKYEYTPEE